MRWLDAADRIGPPSFPRATVGPFVPLLFMASRFTAAILAACGLGFGLVAASYGRYISLSDSPKEAAPFAAPFALFAAVSTASVILSVAAVADGEL